jgi:hypothetical protein
MGKKSRLPILISTLFFMQKLEKYVNSLFQLYSLS